MVYVAVQIPALFVAAIAAPPPNWLKSTVTPAISRLLSPTAVLFHVTVTVSPTLNAPPVPLAPLMLILLSETVGGVVSIARFLFAPREPVEPGDGSVKIAGVPPVSLMDPPFKINAPVLV